MWTEQALRAMPVEISFRGLSTLISQSRFFRVGFNGCLSTPHACHAHQIQLMAVDFSWSYAIGFPLNLAAPIWDGMNQKLSPSPCPSSSSFSCPLHLTMSMYAYNNCGYRFKASWWDEGMCMLPSISATHTSTHAGGHHNWKTGKLGGGGRGNSYYANDPFWSAVWHTLLLLLKVLHNWTVDLVQHPLTCVMPVINKNNDAAPVCCSAPSHLSSI